MVYTNEQYRNRGYGKQVTTGILNWCIENNVLPIYLVDEKNTYSIKLAESLGFKIKSKEIVVSYFI
ncbi:GNAT family N-acetyltransferase [Hathewaya limosa]|uniref:GNAT family acetyltransferase n=1 Tax=Hathewaya limosa TaxID=1536 RepID=A0ABU0JR05_HATLI|nr:GNAT family N-acetyltransferase [Hathewaya limosa]MDQ0478870.1 putative GNAT family acetyltransferase [Hathewaya limosa]